MKHEFRYSPQTITLTRPEDISKFEVGQTAPDEWVEALTGLSMSELSPGGHRQAKVVVSGIDREAGTVTVTGAPPLDSRLDSRPGNRHQRRAEAKHGRLEARRVAKILQAQMTREVEARKAKQDANTVVLPVPDAIPDAEG